MPYYFTDVPADMGFEELWDWFDEAYFHIKSDLVGLRFETFDEAVARVLPISTNPDEYLGATLGIVRFRRTDDRNNLLYFYEEALSLIGELAGDIEARQMSPQFVRKWSMLMSYHGFVVSSIMAHGHDVPKPPPNSLYHHKRWFAYQFLDLRDAGLSRPDAEDIVEDFIRQIVSGRFAMAREWRAWFKRFLSPQHGGLTNAFRQGELSESRMKELVRLPYGNLPRIQLELCPTHGVGKKSRAA